MTKNESAAATATFEGRTYPIKSVGPSFTHVAFYRAEHTDNVLITKHRSEASAAAGKWQSAAMRQVWQHVGFARIDR